MSPLIKLVGFIVENFGPLVIFMAVEPFGGLKAAIGASLVFGVLDIIVRLSTGREISKLYWFCFIVTGVFGALDLYVTDPFIFKYESVATNLLTAGFFGITLFGGKPLIQEFAERTMPPEKKERKDITNYLWFLTLGWTLYFVTKAVVYAFVSYSFPLTQAMQFRSVFGAVTLVGMFAGEKLARPLLFRGLTRLGLLA